MADFPTALPSVAANKYNNTSNAARSKLNGAITGTPSTFDVLDATSETPWPTSNFAVAVVRDDLAQFEIIYISSRTANTLTVGTRGYGGTTQIDHDDASNVYVVFTSDLLQYIIGEQLAIATEIGITGSQSFLRHDGFAGSYAGHLQRTGAGTYSVIKNNLSATVAPTTTDDSASDYAVGSLWIDTTNDKVYICYDATASAALWQEIGAGVPDWVVDTGTSSSLSADEKKLVNNAALHTAALPTTIAAGKEFEIASMNGQIKLSQAAGQTLYHGSDATTTGSGGFYQSNTGAPRVALRIVCVVANTDFQVVSAQGNWTAT